MPKKIKKKKIDKNKDEKQIVRALKSLHFAEYVDFIRSPWKTFWFGFLKGTGIGLGALVGVAIVLSILAYIISFLWDLPVIGDLLNRVEQLEQITKILESQGYNIR